MHIYEKCDQNIPSSSSVMNIFPNCYWTDGNQQQQNTGIHGLDSALSKLYKYIAQKQSTLHKNIPWY